ncbi:HNH endonuclease [Polynucleobacter sp. AM-7D1]|uniref:HNH endonuclease n=1 Tax=Polynucleobacter sp. AM-7D1 TaxID=2689102 RepID=UPI001BFCF4F3|nr:HNH endonuclease [Polynucleobacter sp. AM-7D1]QWE28095.1 HNH endonuclease [Polynucleobacter sp. AM-7D1]
MILKISDITFVGPNKTAKGFVIRFKTGQEIYLHKRRTIPALLTLIKHGEGCESDLSNGATNLKDLKKELGNKLTEGLIQDGYSDANKPFSELWNEEGFVFIENPPKEKKGGSQSYVLKTSDHHKLFSVVKKAERKPPNKIEQAELLKLQKGRCNFCDSIIKSAGELKQTTYAKDRSRLVWDHRAPVEKGGDSDKGNYQALCFYCNKCKWQICNICDLDKKSCLKCALAFPEKSKTISPTGEDISDRAPHHRL